MELWPVPGPSKGVLNHCLFSYHRYNYIRVFFELCLKYIFPERENIIWTENVFAGRDWTLLCFTTTLITAAMCHLCLLLPSLEKAWGTCWLSLCRAANPCWLSDSCFLKSFRYARNVPYFSSFNVLFKLFNFSLLIFTITLSLIDFLSAIVNKFNL